MVKKYILLVAFPPFNYNIFDNHEFDKICEKGGINKISFHAFQHTVMGTSPFLSISYKADVVAAKKPAARVPG